MTRSFKPHIDKLILNYFIQENYKQAVETFAKETNIKLSDNTTSTLTPQSVEFLKAIEGIDDTNEFLDIVQQFNVPETPTKSISSEKSGQMCKGYSTINERAEIKYLILKGQITDAIEKISEYFPTVLDSNNLLHFKLLRLNLIEMIRHHKITTKNPTTESEKQFLDEILKFVRTSLINKVTNSYKLMRELGITMSLLCFNFDENLQNLQDQEDLPEDLRSLFDFSLRSQCYKLVNKAILNLDKLNDPDSSDFKHDQISYDQFKEDTQPHELLELNGVEMKSLQEYLQGYMEENPVITEENEDKNEPLLKSKDTITKEEAIEDEATKLQNLAFDSKLERLMKLWALTVQKNHEMTKKPKEFKLNDELI